MTNATPSSVMRVISELFQDEIALSSAKLSELTNMGKEDLAYFKTVWPNIRLKRRRQVIERLIDLAEDNVELCYDDIFKYALQDEDDEIQVRAIEGLWENEQPSLIASFLSLLERGKSEKVRASAALALGKYIMLAEEDKLRPPHVLKLRDSLLGIIKNTDQPVEVKTRALEAIAPLGLPEVTDVIMQAYQSDNPRLKIGAIYAMGQNCDRSWLPILTKELSSDDAEIRFEAAGACGELEDTEAVPYLAKLVDDSDVDVRMAAVKALGSIGGREAKGFLEECLEHPDDVVRQMAQEALKDLHNRDALSSFQPDR